MRHLKVTLLLQLFHYVIVSTQMYPISQDQHSPLYMSNTPNTKINSLMLRLLIQDFNKHSYNCNDLCDTNTLTDVLQPTKRDVFMSRSWSAGGMPFSVLYMKPKHPKNTRSPIAQPLQLSDNVEHYNKIPKPVHSFDDDYQLLEKEKVQTLSRGGVSPLPSRRQYSTIPQLFVSYGWGPLGK